MLFCDFNSANLGCKRRIHRIERLDKSINIRIRHVVVSGPARDLGPRIAHAILPIKGKGSSNFKYGLIVPIFGPIIGGIVAVLLYNVIPW